MLPCAIDEDGRDVGERSDGYQDSGGGQEERGRGCRTADAERGHHYPTTRARSPEHEKRSPGLHSTRGRRRQGRARDEAGGEDERAPTPRLLLAAGPTSSIRACSSRRSPPPPLLLLLLRALLLLSDGRAPSASPVAPLRPRDARAHRDREDRRQRASGSRPRLAGTAPPRLCLRLAPRRPHCHRPQLELLDPPAMHGARASFPAEFLHRPVGAGIGGDPAVERGGLGRDPPASPRSSLRWLVDASRACNGLLTEQEDDKDG
ncbi:unnamed protein product [Urochloa humidicola]